MTADQNKCDQDKGSCCCGPTPEPEPAPVVEKACGCGCDRVAPAENVRGPIPRVSTQLGWADRIGSWMRRWGIGRSTFRVSPGLYAAGAPGPDAPVLVTANYKMSFDRLRAVLSTIDSWILVLDTRGVNVWCAAGKGTFGTDELVQRLKAVDLGAVVKHRRLIVPQLGATGVSAHQVEAASGWKVRFGPVRAEDLPSCLSSGRLRVPPEMRRVRFPLADRVVLVPVEMVLTSKYILAAVVALLLISGLGPGGYAIERLGEAGVRAVTFLLAGWLGGGALGPLLLPWLPGRAFALKGVWAGLLTLLALMLSGWPSPVAHGLEAGGWLLMSTALASFLTMNFTGASTYTSLSGVRKEMRRFVPLQIAALFLGLGLWIAGLFV